MDRIKRGWKRTPKHVRKPVVFILGGAVILAGLVMLVTPGPGWAALFLGFAIWATEFAFAEKVRDRMIHFLKQLTERAKELWGKLVSKFKHDSKNPKAPRPRHPSSTPRQ